MTYLDMTFCRGGGCAKFGTCPRAYTDKVKAGAERWWGAPNAPIMFYMNPKELDCYETNPLKASEREKEAA